MPIAVYALTAGAFGIGTTEFVIMGLLLQVAADLQVSVAMTGLLISGYALGVFVGAPVLTLATRKLPRKQVLILLMAIFHPRQHRLCARTELRAADGGTHRHLAGAWHLLRRRPRSLRPASFPRTRRPRPSR